MIDNEVISRIAQKIRATRLLKNMTIQQLATRMNVSKGLISKIENAKTTPSLPVFVTLLQSLDISLKEFFDDMLLTNGREFIHIKKDLVKPPDKNSHDGLAFRHILSQNISYCTMEVMLVTIEPGSSGKTRMSGGYEFIYILCGSCESQINTDRILLEEGDAIYVDASVAQTLFNNTRRKVSLLAIGFTVGQQQTGRVKPQSTSL